MAVRTRGRDKSGHVDPYHARRKRFESVLGPLGMWDLFKAMPRFVQEQFFQLKLRDPVVEWDDTMPAEGEAREEANALRLEVEKCVREATFIGANGRRHSVRDFNSVIAGLMVQTRAVDTDGAPESVLLFIEVARVILSEIYEANNPLMSEQLAFAMHPLPVAKSRLDRRLYSMNYGFALDEREKQYLRIVLSAAEPEERKVSIDGKPRAMYRAATSGLGGVNPISVSGKQLGRRELPAEIPVFVQRHALEQLKKRVNIPSTALYHEYWLTMAMKEPRVIKECGRGDLLVEYRIGEHRVGYLVVTPRKDCAIVRTFLFLTMENTPAAKLLHQKLKLTRGDRDWLGLHELAAFTNTDLRTDPVLRPLLEKCGCGHLFKLVEDVDDLAPKPVALAEEMKKYLRMAA